MRLLGKVDASTLPLRRGTKSDRRKAKRLARELPAKKKEEARFSAICKAAIDDRTRRERKARGQARTRDSAFELSEQLSKIGEERKDAESSV